MTPATVKLTIDDRPVEVAAGTTIFDAAQALGIAIPTLCHAQHQTPVAVCRVCSVEVKNARVMAAACIRPVEEGMEVHTGTPRVQGARRTLYELLLADHPAPCLRQQATGDCDLETLATEAGVASPRFAAGLAHPPVDDSSPIIKVDRSACILCDRCIRACTEIKHNNVIGRMGKGGHAAISFDLGAPMGQSTCVGCGECMVTCPTGALTNKKVLDVELLAGDPVPVDTLLETEMFSGVSGNFLALNQGSVVRRTFAPGEVICREGEQGSTAFYIERGRVQVMINTPMAHARSGSGVGSRGAGMLRRITELVKWGAEPREEATRRYIPIDGPVDLDVGNPVAELAAGELFGEMTCMSLYPRSATVRALEETVVYEMLRNVLHMLQKNKRFRAELDRRYRERALVTHLKSVPILAGVSDEFIAYLRDRVTLARFQPGDVICRQGDVADMFFLVRLGFIKVSQAFPGGEMVLRYLGRGDYFGEMGLLAGGTRVATCSALDHVEVVRIDAETFTEMITRFPAIREGLQSVATARAAENEARRQQATGFPIDQFIAQGLMEAQNLLLIDLEKCTRCDQCVRACADAHDDVTRLVRDGLRFDKYLVATSCRSCRDPLCMVGCPVGSIRRRESLEIMIEDWCIGCGLCAKNCPYGNINLHPFQVTVDDEAHPGRKKAAVREKATTCDLSRELKEPACVYACPHDALVRVKEPAKYFADRLGPTR